MYHTLALESQTGEVIVLPHPADRKICQENDAVVKELLMFTGPYAHTVGMSHYLGARIFTAIHHHEVPTPPFSILEREELFVVVAHLAESQHIEVNQHFVCNFTKGVFLKDPDPYPTWFKSPSEHIGRTLLQMILLEDPELSWNGDEIAVVPVVFKWMNDATDDCYELLSKHC